MGTVYYTHYYGDQFEIFNKWRTENPKEIESTPVLWKRDLFECIKTGFFWLSDTPGIESRGWDELYNCPRMCVYVILKEKSSGKAFAVMNTHFGPDSVKNKRIDYCFVDKGVSPIDLKTIKDTVDGNYPSDHYGLWVKLEI